MFSITIRSAESIGSLLLRGCRCRNLNHTRRNVTAFTPTKGVDGNASPTIIQQKLDRGKTIAGQMVARNTHVVTCKDGAGNQIDSKHVTERFKRLGNGIWVKRLRNYDSPQTLKIARWGPKYIYRISRHVICSRDMAKNLDKLVTRKFKKHRWTVSDPYAGYDEDVKFYYNPFDIPGVNKGKMDERREMSWVRYQEQLELKKQSISKHGRRERASHRQKPLTKNMYYH